MSDTPRTDQAFNHAATLSTFAHQRRYLMAQMESLERENATLTQKLDQRTHLLLRSYRLHTGQLTDEEARELGRQLAEWRQSLSAF